MEYMFGFLGCIFFNSLYISQQHSPTKNQHNRYEQRREVQENG